MKIVIPKGHNSQTDKAIVTHKTKPKPKGKKKNERKPRS